MSSRENLKEALVKTLIEKGEYAKAAQLVTENTEPAKERVVTRILPKLTKGRKAVINEHVTALVEENNQKISGAVQETLTGELEEVKQEIKDLFQSAKVELQNELVKNVAAEVTRNVAQIEIPTVEPIRLSESEISEMVDNASLAVESQLDGIISAYWREQVLTASQISDFTQKVLEIIPERIDWEKIDNKPTISQGGTNVNLVNQLIATAIAGISGGVSDGDKGDITVSASGSVWTIDNGVVTAAKTAITGTPTGSKYLRDDFSWQPVVGGSGITRSITITSGSATMGASADTDYVYLVAGAHTMTLPTAVGNTNRYTVKNNHSAAVTVDTTSAQTIDGTTTISINPQSSVDIISNNTNWFII